MSEMSKPEDVERDLGELYSQGEDITDAKLWSKEFQLKRAIKAKYFREEVLPLLKEYAPNLREPSCETFIFTSKRGTRFTYYSSKEGLVEQTGKNKSWRKIIPADKLLNYLSNR